MNDKRSPKERLESARDRLLRAGAVLELKRIYTRPKKSRGKRNGR